jgi:predicted PurR-regulated permease PerM
VAALHLGRSLLLPVALSILLAFVLTPSVVYLEKRVRSRVLAVTLVTMFAAGFLGLVVLGVGQQFMGLAEDLPSYRETLVRRARQFRVGTASVVSEAAETIRAVGKELDKPTTDPASTAPVPATVPPRAPPAGLISSVKEALGPLAVPLGMGALAAVLTVMMLVYREGIRDRVIRLAGLQQISLTTRALEETGERVGRYLRSQLMINLGFGLVIMGGLWFIGVPRAAVCGLIAGLLRFVPIIGPWLGALVPLTLALVAFDDWMHPLLVGGLFLAAELVVNVAVEPWVYGMSTGISRLGVVLAIAFWAWVWGPVGLLMAMPVTVCLLVFARHVPQLEVLTVVLGEEAPLSEPVRFYHRLLCDDEDQAEEVLEGVEAAARSHGGHGRDRHSGAGVRAPGPSARDDHPGRCGADRPRGQGPGNRLAGGPVGLTARTSGRWHRRGSPPLHRRVRPGRRGDPRPLPDASGIPDDRGLRDLAPGRGPGCCRASGGESPRSVGGPSRQRRPVAPGGQGDQPAPARDAPRHRRVGDPQGWPTGDPRLGC